MVLQSSILKRFLAGTYINHLNRVSESEKNEDFKNCSFPEKGIRISWENHFKIFKD